MEAQAPEGSPVTVTRTYRAWAWNVATWTWLVLVVAVLSASVVHVLLSVEPSILYR